MLLALQACKIVPFPTDFTSPGLFPFFSQQSQITILFPIPASKASQQSKVSCHLVLRRFCMSYFTFTSSPKRWLFAQYFTFTLIFHIISSQLLYWNSGNWNTYLLNDLLWKGLQLFQLCNVHHQRKTPNLTQPTENCFSESNDMTEVEDHLVQTISSPPYKRVNQSILFRAISSQIFSWKRQSLEVTGSSLPSKTIISTLGKKPLYFPQLKMRLSPLNCHRPPLAVFFMLLSDIHTYW